MASPPVAYSTVINSQEHGARVTIAAAYGLTAAWMFLLLRFYVRWPLKHLFQWDDAVLTFATCLASVQVGVVLAAVDHGLGTVPSLLSQSSIEDVEKTVYASSILWVIVTYTSRVAVALFLRRLSNVGLHTRFNLALLACCGAFGAVSICLVAIKSPYSHPWSAVTESGSQTVARWVVVEILLSIIDLCTVATATHIVWDLQMSPGKKLRVVLLFALRLPLIVLAALHMNSLSYTLHLPRRYPAISDEPEIYGQIEMAWCLISATLPCLANFFRATQTTINDGGGAWSSVDNTHAATKGSTGHDGTARREWELSALRPGKGGARATKAPAADENSVKSDNSQREILRAGSWNQAGTQ